MDFDQIRAFIKVAELRSFSEAGEKLFISQPSVSVRVKALEEELGVILLDRSKAREPSLTDAGRIFLDYAQSIMKLNDECREKLSGKREKSTGLLYTGASTVPGIYLLPPLLAGFRKKHPAVEFNISILDTAAVLEGVLDYSFDLGLVGLIKQDDRLNYLALMEDELVFCTAGGLLEQDRFIDGFPLEQLFAHHLILREKGSATRQLLEKVLVKNGFSMDQFKGITYINSLEGIKHAVKAGLGAAVVSKLSIADLVGLGELDQFTIKDVDLKRSLYLVYHHRRVLTGAAEEFIAFAAACSDAQQ
ncbi:MAG: LysR family transcriptional regulator [Firmicutes bacterium]|nr:LysR family transcriptional regulator [Bacillota bacterium]